MSFGTYAALLLHFPQHRVGKMFSSDAMLAEAINKKARATGELTEKPKGKGLADKETQ